ncbi:MAG TPA: hypothetical protein VFG83_14650 [Kofleriaceae bacterium]|nr:hypothetical protein [Kofleriaceae bacterium]
MARLAPSFPALRPEVEYRIRALCVRHALRYAPEGDHVAACERVIDLCDRAAGGDSPASEEWAAAEAAADSLIDDILDVIEADLSRPEIRPSGDIKQ